MTLAVIALSIAVALLVFLVAGLLRSHADILRRLHQLEGGRASSVEAPAEARVLPVTAAPPARRAHDLTGVAPRGDALAVRVTDTDRDTLLVFLSSGCGTCAGFWEQLAGSVDLPERTRLVVVTAGPEHESPAAVAAVAAPHLTVVMSDDAQRDYAIPGTPYVVLVDGRTGGIVGEGTGQSWEQVARSMAEATGDTAYLGAPAGPKAPRDRDRERDTDRELLEAGFVPGDPRLYQPLDDDAVAS